MTVGTDESVLEALTRAGLDITYDCRKGECGLCLLDVSCLDGVIDHRDVFLSAHQPAASRMGERKLGDALMRFRAD